MDWELFTYIVWTVNIIVTIVVFITLIRKRKIKEELQKNSEGEETHPIEEIYETERVEKKIKPLSAWVAAKPSALTHESSWPPTATSKPR